MTLFDQWSHSLKNNHGTIQYGTRVADEHLCDKSLFFEKRVHSATNIETGEKREARSAGSEVPAIIPLGLR